MFKRKNKYIDEHYELPITAQVLISIISIILIIIGVITFCNWDDKQNNVDYIEIIE